MKTSKDELTQKMALNPNEVSAFGEETLNEMAMEDVEGGLDVDIKLGKNPDCTITNNCHGGNCSATALESAQFA